MISQPSNNSLTQSSYFEKRENIKVIVRVRPFFKEESSKNFIEQINVQKTNFQTTFQQENTLKILKPGNNIIMRFSDILNSGQHQLDMFQLTTDAIEEFINGKNTSIFAQFTYSIESTCLIFIYFKADKLEQEKLTPLLGKQKK